MFQGPPIAMGQAGLIAGTPLNVRCLRSLSDRCIPSDSNKLTSLGIFRCVSGMCAAAGETRSSSGWSIEARCASESGDGRLGSARSFVRTEARRAGFALDRGARRKSMMVRSAHHDGLLPLNLPMMSDGFHDSSITASTIETLLDPSSSLLESSTLLDSSYRIDSSSLVDSPTDSSTVIDSSTAIDSSTLLQSPAPSSTAPLRETPNPFEHLDRIEEKIERAIFDFRFLTLFGVVGSLLGAILCFFKGCLFVVSSYKEYFRACLAGVHSGRVILYLVEAVDVYLMGTVMLIFGMGLYELFVRSLEVPSVAMEGSNTKVVSGGSSLFGLFRLRERPKWLEIRSLDELKTKLGHVIVMILLVGMFEKSKKVVVLSAMDFLCFSASILLSSGALFLLSMLHNGKHA